MTMIHWCLAAALADPAPAQALRGQTRSLGDSPLTFVLRETGDGQAVAELRWDAYDRVTIEAVVPVRAGCDGDVLAEGRDRVGALCRSIDQRVKDPHPIYDYVSDTRVRCVIGASGDAPVAWCKLNYTGWFALRSAPTD